MFRLLSPKGAIALTIIVAVILVAVLAPVVVPADLATQMHMALRLRPPSPGHWLGTDVLGRDLFYRVLLGARTSLSIAAAAVGISVAFGLPLGIASGYLGGWIDLVLMRLVDALLSFPALLLALTISAMLGPSVPNTIVAIGVAFTPFLARIVRGEALRIAQMPYVEAARSGGTSDLAMIVRHVLPNVLPLVIVQGTISLAFAILAEAALSFLGLGTQPPHSSWGTDDPSLPRLPRRGALDRAGAGCGRGADRTRLQHVRRRVARRARSEGALTNPGEPILAVSNLRVEFETGSGPVVAAADVSFEVRPGETLCVVGESGSGKSVTALAIMRLVEFGGGRITGGRIAFTRQGGSVTNLAAADPGTMRGIRGNEIGMIFQEPMTSLNPVFTIGRQLFDGLQVHRGLTAAAARARALELMEEVRIPEPERRLRQYPHELSGGMRQRVVIAMAMACRPRLLIADEPTTALDVTIQAEILALIDRLKRETGMAVLFITHDMAVVAQMADRVAVMHRGALVEQGAVGQIFAAPRELYTQTLLAAVPRLGEMRDHAGPIPMRTLGGASVPPPAGQLANAPREILLDVKHLSTRFPVRSSVLRRRIANVHAVEDVSFAIARGETLSLVGESGCGKSSCGRSVLRLVEADRGEIRLDGENIRSLGRLELRRARRNMQMIFQDPFASLNPYRRLGDQVGEPLKNFAIASGSDAADRVAHLFDRVQLPRDFIRRFPHELSGGQRQRVAIARALAPGPKLLVADESVSALDVSVQAQVLNLLMSIQAELGLSFLFISHDMAVVERVSHQVAVMYLGRIVEIGPRAAVFEDPRHPYTKSLLAAVPVADPAQRRTVDDRAYRPLPSPILPITATPLPSVYDEVATGHFVLQPT